MSEVDREYWEKGVVTYAHGNTFLCRSVAEKPANNGRQILLNGKYRKVVHSSMNHLDWGEEKQIPQRISKGQEIVFEFRADTEEVVGWCFIEEFSLANLRKIRKSSMSCV